MKFTDLWPIRPIADPRAVIAGDGYRITVLTDRLLRLEYEPQGRFCDDATQIALCREFPVPQFTAAERDGHLVIETDALRLTYDGKPFSQTGLQVMLKGQFSFYASIWHYGDAPDTLGGTARTLDNADGAIPLDDGIASSKGYAVLDDGASMRMDAEGNLLPAKEHGIDLYFFGYGRDFHGALRDFLKLSGKVPPLPRYALGNWWSRFYPYSQDEYRQLMERFTAEGVPLSVSVLDMNWHVTQIDPAYGPGWTGYTWDREKFPEPEKLLSWLHEHGLAVTLNDHPAEGVRAFEDQYERMARELGEPADGRPFHFDAADGKFLRAFEKAVLEPHEDAGVDFWWLDWQQAGGTSDPGVDPLFVLNHTRYVHALERGIPAMAFSRYGGPGSHRYPIGFSGDTCATWESLAFQPYFTATAANIGYGWWSHDIGGHMHGTRDDELALRWLQFGVFSPVMRLHSSSSRFMRKEPWEYPATICAAMKDFLRLRHRLIPWLYTQNLLCSREDRAFLRPMYYDYSSASPMLHVHREQYLLGDGLLVCPITSKVDEATGLACVKAELPEGEWIDIFTGDRYAGRRTLNLYRPLERIPVLAKAGTILPMDASEVPANGVALPGKVLLRAFAGADGDAQLIEDNGELHGSAAYRSATTRFAMKTSEGFSFEILPPEGDASVLPAKRRYAVELIGVEERKPDEASCAYEMSYDADRRALTIALEGDASRGLRVAWHRPLACPAPDWKEALRALLSPAHIEFSLKDVLMFVAARSADATAFLAQAYTMNLPQSLFGAMLELLSVR